MLAVLEVALVLQPITSWRLDSGRPVAAAFRADPYAVVSTGLGPASGSWRTGSSGAPSEVEGLLREAESGDPEAAIGARLHRTGEVVHGFGMLPAWDPRAQSQVGALSGLDRRSKVPPAARRAGTRHRRDLGFPASNVDLGLETTIAPR